jgi:hypothetical protein
VPSVASNNLTVAIKTLADTDPSATNPVGIWIGNNLRWITSSLSIAANAGTNWFNSGGAELATREIDYFAYIGYNATDGITLGYARIPYAKLYSDFNTTTTNARYARISTITNAAAGDNYVNIGRFAATLSASASFNWSVPAFTNANLIQEPIYNTRGLIYTFNNSVISWTGGGGTAPTATDSGAIYYIHGNKLIFDGWYFSAGTSGNTALYSLSMPFTPDFKGVSVRFAGNGYYSNTATVTQTRGRMLSGATIEGEAVVSSGANFDLNIHIDYLI